MQVRTSIHNSFECWCEDEMVTRVVVVFLSSSEEDDGNNSSQARTKLDSSTCCCCCCCCCDDDPWLASAANHHACGSSTTATFPQALQTLEQQGKNGPRQRSILVVRRPQLGRWWRRWPQQLSTRGQLSDQQVFHLRGAAIVATHWLCVAASVIVFDGSSRERRATSEWYKSCGVRACETPDDGRL